MSRNKPFDPYTEIPEGKMEYDICTECGSDFTAFDNYETKCEDCQQSIVDEIQEYYGFKHKMSDVIDSILSNKSI